MEIFCLKPVSEKDLLRKLSNQIGEKFWIIRELLPMLKKCHIRLRVNWMKNILSM